MPRFWANVIGNQLVWLCAVIGAGHGLRWPALVAAAVYVGSQLVWSAQPSVEVRLMLVALGCGLLVDGLAGASGWVLYAAGNDPTWIAPAWILALWAAFAMTLTVSFAVLQRHLVAAALVGLLLAPLAYLSAARGWSSVVFAAPQWHGVLLLGLGWAIALPVLAACARHWQTRAVPLATLAPGDTR
ncbi:DUF2878 domain-containing protein [Stenotrophomonas sp. SRS1]|uniref:DUF2878 domain-containing protein n=1 Tax=Stenotrophomonas sp. SRS1 TaxID=2870345 RepID=UPI002237C41F|nr:DUF2878 domain-containing protein [Stenotrophomonas sp. SRS1]MCW6029608.1 DUF2878 domain-containing protein [Stenotrophomonas sp. SRS1]